MLRIFTLIALSFFTVLPPSVNAQDEGLYDPVAPAGSAFFRFIHVNNSEEAKDVTLSAKGRDYGTQNYQDISDYFVAKKGKRKFEVGEMTVEQDLESDKYYSILNTADGLLVVEDAPLENPAKALITFYNLSDSESLTLKTAEKDIEIIKEIAPNTNGSREINAVKINLAVTDGNTKTITLDPLLLNRKNAYIIAVFTDEAGELEALVQTSKTDTTK